MMPNNAPHSALRRAVARGVQSHGALENHVRCFICGHVQGESKTENVDGTHHCCADHVGCEMRLGAR